MDLLDPMPYACLSNVSKCIHRVSPGEAATTGQPRPLLLRFRTAPTGLPAARRSPFGAKTCRNACEEPSISLCGNKQLPDCPIRKAQHTLRSSDSDSVGCSILKESLYRRLHRCGSPRSKAVRISEMRAVPPHRIQIGTKRFPMIPQCQMSSGSSRNCRNKSKSHPSFALLLCQLQSEVICPYVARRVLTALPPRWATVCRR